MQLEFAIAFPDGTLDITVDGDGDQTPALRVTWLGREVDTLPPHVWRELRLCIPQYCRRMERWFGGAAHRVDFRTLAPRSD